MESQANTTPEVVPRQLHLFPVGLSLVCPGLGQLVQGRKISALYAFLYIFALAVLYSISVGSVDRWMINCYDFFRINFYALFVIFPLWVIFLSVLDAAAWKKDQPSPRVNRFVKFGVWSIVFIILGTFLLLLSSLREAGHNLICCANVKNIGFAMHHYHDKYKSFPPAYTVDENGKLLHSWRVLILPYFNIPEYKTLFEKIRLDEPWDSEYNRQFHEANIPTFSCPAGVRSGVVRRLLPNVNTAGMSYYSVVLGQETPFPGSEMTTFGDITDGTSNTLLVVERLLPVCWMDPNNEIRFDTAIKGVNRSIYGIGSAHSHAAFAVTASGLETPLMNSIEPETLRAWLTKSAGD